jgi:hypothetical protein
MKASDPVNLNLKIKLQDKDDSFIKSPVQEKTRTEAQSEWSEIEESKSQQEEPSIQEEAIKMSDEEVARLIEASEIFEIGTQEELKE